jgi:hypothetical protein
MASGHASAALSVFMTHNFYKIFLCARQRWSFHTAKTQSGHGNRVGITNLGWAACQVQKMF